MYDYHYSKKHLLNMATLALLFYVFLYLLINGKITEMRGEVIRQVRNPMSYRTGLLMTNFDSSTLGKFPARLTPHHIHHAPSLYLRHTHTPTHTYAHTHQHTHLPTHLVPPTQISGLS